MPKLRNIDSKSHTCIASVEILMPETQMEGISGLWVLEIARTLQPLGRGTRKGRKMNSSYCPSTNSQPVRSPQAGPRDLLIGGSLSDVGCSLLKLGKLLAHWDQLTSLPPLTITHNSFRILISLKICTDLQFFLILGIRVFKGPGSSTCVRESRALLADACRCLLGWLMAWSWLSGMKCQQFLVYPDREYCKF